VSAPSTRERERESEWLVSDRKRTPSESAESGDLGCRSWGDEVDGTKGNGDDDGIFWAFGGEMGGDWPLPLFFRSLFLDPSSLSLFSCFLLIVDEDLVRLCCFSLSFSFSFFFLCCECKSWLFDRALRFLSAFVASACSSFLPSPLSSSFVPLASLEFDGDVDEEDDDEPPDAFDCADSKSSLRVASVSCLDDEEPAAEVRSNS
jgi:hypothetical protein